MSTKENVVEHQSVHRIAVVREGTRPVTAPGEPQDIESLPSGDMFVLWAVFLLLAPDQIHRKDGSGSIDIVRGRIADDSGTIGFLSWEPFEHEVGTLLKIEGAQVRTFRDTPELNFGRTTKIEIYHDKNFSDADTLSQQTVLTLSELKRWRSGCRCSCANHRVDETLFHEMAKNDFCGLAKLQTLLDTG